MIWNNKKSWMYAFIVTMLTFNTAAQDSLKQANLLFKNENYKASYNMLVRLIKKDPGNIVYRFNVANNLLKMGLYKKSAAQYKIVATSADKLRLPAKVYLAQCLRELGEKDKALQLLDDVLQADPDDRVYNLAVDEAAAYSNEDLKRLIRQGRKRLDEGDSRAAAKYFHRALVIRPDDRLYYLLGRVYVRLNRKEDAKEQFSYIKDDKLYEKGLLLLGEQLLPEESPQEESPIETKPKRFSFYFDGAYGTNSNPYTQAESSSTSITTTEVEADTQTNYALGGTVNAFKWNNTNFGLGVDISNESYSSDETIETGLTSFTFPIHYVPEHRKWDLTFTPILETSKYGGDDYTSNTVFDIGHVYFKENYRTSYQLTYTSYSPDSEDYSYLEGSNTTFTFRWTYYFKHSDVGLGFSVGKESLQDTDDNIGSNSNRTFILTHYYPISEKWVLSSSLNYLSSTFEADSSGFVQEDTRLTLSSQLNYVLKPWAELYGSFRHMNNTSNLDDSTDNNNYTQLLIQVGVSLIY